MSPLPRNSTPYEDVLGTIGSTPLIRLNRVTRGIATPVYGKADFFNPGGSVKDRIGLPIIEQAEREGRLQPGGTIVEGTSGNTGIGLAIAAALKGYRCIFTMPDKMSQEKVRLLKAFGAQVIVTPTAVPPDHPDNYVMTAKRIAEETPNAILANQFYNQANPQAHYDTTGPELWEQTEGRITHFVASAGTGGTITGVGRYLKEKNPDIKIVAGDPVGSILADYWRSGEKIEGVPYKVEGIGQDKVPGTLDMKIIDDYRTVSDRDAFAMARRLTREEGLFVGGSSGLIAHVALEVAREVNDPNAMIVTFLQRRVDAREPAPRARPREHRRPRRDQAALRARHRRHHARLHGAPGAPAHEPARRLAAPGDGWRRLHRLGERVVRVGPRARGHQAPRCHGQRSDGRALPGGGWSPAARERGQAAQQNEPRRARSAERPHRRDRHPLGCAPLHDGTIDACRAG
jgi:cysteine synthase